MAALPSAKLGMGKVATASSTLSWSAMSMTGKATLAGIGVAAALAVGVVVSSDDAPEPTPKGTVAAAAGHEGASASASRQAKGSPVETPQAEPNEPASPEPTVPPAATAPAKPATPAKPTMSAPEAPRSLAAENALLRDAAQALAAGNAAQALELANRHAKEHAGSPMIDISTAMRIESLCALGKQAQARGEAAMFLRRRPKSPMADRIRDACPEKSEGASKKSTAAP